MSNSSEPIIHVTDAAAHKVHQLVVEEENLKLNLRAFITGGGCSGFQYGFTFDEIVNDDDTVVEKKVTSNDEDISMCLVIDALSLQYLKGAEIDYRENIEGAQFVIRNPNAKTTCGCGSSFSA
ncbi:MAG: iron-sulfur cluster insertion protein ErpA [Coxiellaceae bacterium]|nr:iron-sulfur cluster insertion protein ErpA [Coxiellaceae bacterium]|tara:strand:- start:8739 stop:9107 length:369 start_codon:yes stop_codon:yes gene_type:complete